ncbi:MAG: excinuclease ABC subunit UvrC [Methanobacteriota archaeon]
MDLRHAAKTAPAGPGVYLMHDRDGTVVYVGKSARLRDRLTSYLHVTDPWKVEMVGRIAKVEILVTNSEKEAWILEESLIKRYRPRYNVLLTDDKRSPYVKVTNDPFPRILVTRAVLGDGAHYFGPFPEAGAAKRTMRLLRDTFKVRDCRELPKKHCINFEIGICTAPCEGLVSREAYAAQVDEVVRILRGDIASVKRSLKDAMERASAEEDFEEAARLRDRIRDIAATVERQAVFALHVEDRDAVALAKKDELAVAVVLFVRHGRVVGHNDFAFRTPADVPDALAGFLDRYYADLPAVPAEVVLAHGIPDPGGLAARLSERRGARVEVTVPERGEKARLARLAAKNAEFRLSGVLSRRGEAEASGAALQKALGLPAPPGIVHGFDISHLAGTEVVGSRVAFSGGLAEKSAYRRFKVAVDANDDFAAMKEVVSRSYDGEPLPDLVLIDGGPGQLSAALRALDALGLSVPIVAIAKRDEELFLPDRRIPLKLPRDDAGLKFLQRVRDEAHRFAVSYQRNRRKMAIEESPLDQVAGLGPKRKRALLLRFRSVSDIAASPVERISEVKGIGPALAKRVKEALAGDREIL